MRYAGSTLPQGEGKEGQETVNLAPTSPKAAHAESPIAISARNVTQRYGEVGAPHAVLALDTV